MSQQEKWVLLKEHSGLPSGKAILAAVITLGIIALGFGIYAMSYMIYSVVISQPPASWFSYLNWLVLLPAGILFVSASVIHSIHFRKWLRQVKNIQR